MATEEETSEYAFTSFNYIKRSSKAITLTYLQNIWQNSNQGKSYKKLNYISKWDANQITTEKKILLIYIQLKVEYRYFNSYLTNISNSDIQEK
jgi:hypothetical protein